MPGKGKPNNAGMATKPINHTSNGKKVSSKKKAK